jgi:hypothetical protein
LPPLKWTVPWVPVSNWLAWSHCSYITAWRTATVNTFVHHPIFIYSVPSSFSCISFQLLIWLSYTGFALSSEYSTYCRINIRTLLLWVVEASGRASYAQYLGCVRQPDRTVRTVKIIARAGRTRDLRCMVRGTERIAISASVSSHQSFSRSWQPASAMRFSPLFIFSSYSLLLNLSLLLIYSFLLTPAYWPLYLCLHHTLTLALAIFVPSRSCNTCSLTLLHPLLILFTTFTSAFSFTHRHSPQHPTLPLLACSTLLMLAFRLMNKETFLIYNSMVPCPDD